MRLARKLNQDQVKDAGLALLLILLLVFQLAPAPFLFWPAIVVLLVVMTYPPLFKPWAYIWFSLSHILNAIVSRLVLGIIFFLVATPVGCLRRVFGADAMRLKRWKDGSNSSAFVARNHTYSKEDFENLF